MNDYVYTISDSTSDPCKLYLPEVDEEISGLESEPQDDNEEEILGLIENFIEAYNICKEDEEKIIVILEKKNSERSNEEKQTIRKIVKSNKRDTPKIEIERQKEYEESENEEDERDEGVYDIEYNYWNKWWSSTSSKIIS